MCGKCENWILGLLGLVVVVWPFLAPVLAPVLGLTADVTNWVYVVVGLVIAGLAAWKEFGKPKATA